MSNSDVSSAPSESPIEPQPAACAGGCQYRNSGILRALIYTPVVLLIGGLVALATFPNLAEYAGPLIGETSANSSCQLNVPGMSVGSAPCCSSMRGPTAGMSAAELQFGACCMTESTSCSVSEKTLVDSNDLTNSTLTVDGTDESPADAIAAVNVVETQIAQ